MKKFFFVDSIREMTKKNYMRVKDTYILDIRRLVKSTDKYFELIY